MIRSMKTAALISGVMLLTTPLSHANLSHQPKHFPHIMVVVFENMSYAEIKNEPTFKKLVEYSGNTLDSHGKLVKLPTLVPTKDSTGNGYAFFSRYFNNHSGGTSPTRPSQPNYIAMTSGSIQNVHDNFNHNLDVDNLALELIDANVTWKVYADDLPDPKDLLPAYNWAEAFSPSSAIKPYVLSQNKNEQENDDAQQKFNTDALKKLAEKNTALTSHCFTSASHPNDDGYHRKHEPFISYSKIQSNYNYCKNIVNSTHLVEDLTSDKLASVIFYIPNQINDGHNGTLAERVKRANNFLSSKMGADPKTGAPLPNADHAPFQRFMAKGGLLVITFDEPSVTGNPDNSIYTLFAGKMINSGAYPDKSGLHAPTCYPPTSAQNTFTTDEYGLYEAQRCNHYNLLKLIESNWQLRGLVEKNTSSGYKQAYSLDTNVSELWKASL